MLKHCLSALFLMALPLAANAASPETLPPLASPARAVLSPSLATLFVRTSIPVETIDGSPCIRILLPANAADLQISLDGARILRMSRRAVIGAPDGGLSRERTRMEKEIAGLEGRSKAILARIEYGAEDISRGIDIQALYAENAGIKKQIKTLQDTLKDYPESMERRTLVTAALSEQPGSSVDAEYSYKIPDCSWRPEYNIACSPQKDGKGTISVRLEALVEQSSCFDWNGTEIQLVTTGTGSGVRPPSLRSWNIGQEAAQLRERSRALEDGAGAAMMAAAPMMERKNAPVKPAVADLSGAFASWIPAISPPSSLSAYAASAASSSADGPLSASILPPGFTSGSSHSHKMFSGATARATAASKRSRYAGFLPASSLRICSAQAFSSSVWHTSARNSTRLFRLSISVKRASGSITLSGTPGSPAPLPTSITLEQPERYPAAVRLSR